MRMRNLMAGMIAAGLANAMAGAAFADRIELSITEGRQQMRRENRLLRCHTAWLLSIRACVSVDEARRELA